jgi:hypothetical protein
VRPGWRAGEQTSGLKWAGGQAGKQPGEQPGEHIGGQSAWLRAGGAHELCDGRAGGRTVRKKCGTDRQAGGHVCTAGGNFVESTTNHFHTAHPQRERAYTHTTHDCPQRFWKRPFLPPWPQTHRVHRLCSKLSGTLGPVCDLHRVQKPASLRSGVASVRPNVRCSTWQLFVRRTPRLSLLHVPKTAVSLCRGRAGCFRCAAFVSSSDFAERQRSDWAVHVVGWTCLLSHERAVPPSIQRCAGLSPVPVR